MLPPKRKKSLKIDNTEKIKVLDMKDIDPSCLEEFTLPPIDSGMEAEEEKEVHLKKVIENKKGDIPVPVILEVDDYVSIRNIVPSKYCKYHKDVNISYWFSDEDYELIKGLQIDENEYMKIIRVIQSEIDDNQRVINKQRPLQIQKTNYTLNSIDNNQAVVNLDNVVNADINNIDPNNVYNLITNNVVNSESNISLIDDKIYKNIYESIKYKFLLRDECAECPSYVCFRRRILKPSRKNRRSESQATEKITKLYSEFILLIKMSNIYREIQEIDNEILNVDLEISNITNELLIKHEDIKKKVRNVLRYQVSRQVHQTVTQEDLFHDILHNRDNIRIIRKKLKGINTHYDEEAPKEWAAYIKYCQDKL
ncbi:uncharacterized protein VNE69_02083 [Vairimorpha necatrix]|uniref:Uncharacterized protein n=1 Tax=Vairimorpha necatrix TaxID=6039 RepID=A0AAX4J9E9_9MICR